MNLIIGNRAIDTDIYKILLKCKSELHSGKLRDIVDKGKNILITCPFHKDGKENHPSCQVYADYNGEMRPGEFHCFTCQAKGSLEKLIAQCFDESEDFSKSWLKENFGDMLVVARLDLKPIELKPKENIKYLSEDILDQYKYFHPYMFKRKLTEDIIKKFSIGFDEKTNCIVFPVWDEKNRLVMLTRRSVLNKNFYIDKDKEKPVYLLNFALKENIKTLYIMESQINALTGWVYGYPSCALMGTGTPRQYTILGKCGIKHFVLCLDGDDAGDSGTFKLIKNLPKDCIIDVKVMKRGYDVNDLSKEEFEKLPVINSHDWLKNMKK